MIKVVIFDMDGVMIDSERVTYEEYIPVCKKYNREMTREYYGTILGVNQKTVYERHRIHFGEDFPAQAAVAEVLVGVRNRFIREGVPVKSGLYRLLDRLKHTGRKVILATSSSRVRVDEILSMIGLDKAFDDVVCGDEVREGKPNPEIFELACSKAGVSADEAIVIEDSDNGVRAAYSAGIRCVCVPDMKEPDASVCPMIYKIDRELEHVFDTVIKVT